jgi:dolichyl-phosphate beta-glucosyltransferase
MSSPDVSLILPAYNEAHAIAGAIAEARGYFQARGLAAEIIVAADGGDGTRELVRELAVNDPALKAIGHRERAGKGRGVREGVALAAGAIIGYADADRKVPIEEFAAVEPWLSQGFEVVLGSRALAASRVERRPPLYRRMGSRGFAVFMQAVVGLPGIFDTQCGFKFFSRGAAKRVFSHQRVDGYMFDVEILAIAQRLGYRIKEVPVRWRDDGDSRLDLVSGNLRNVRDLFRIRRSLAKLGAAA